jgi:hypothetical protein
MQYVRTNKIKQQLIKSFDGEERLKQKGINFENCWGPLMLCLATQVAHSITFDDYNLILIHANGDERFITGDQPVINFDQSPNVDGEPSTFEIFYPISPEKAILLVKEQHNIDRDWDSIKDEDVSFFNRLIQSESLEQVYASSDEQLIKLIKI